MEQLKTRVKSLLVLILALMLTLEGTAVPVHADGETGETEYLIVLQNISVAEKDLDGIEGGSDAYTYDARFLAAYKSTNGKITEMIDGNQIKNSNVRSLQGTDIDVVEKLKDIQSEKGATVYVLTQADSGMYLDFKDQHNNYVSTGSTDNDPVKIYETADDDTKGSSVSHYFYKFEEVKSIMDAFITCNPYGYDTGRVYDFDAEPKQWKEIHGDKITKSLLDVAAGGNDTRIVSSADISSGFGLKFEFYDRKLSLPPVIYLKPGESQKLTATLTPPPEWDDPEHPEKTYNWYRCYSGKTYAKGVWYDHGVPSWNEKKVPVTIDDYGNITAKSTAANGDKCFVAATYKKNESIEGFCEVRIADASVTYFADPAGTEVLDTQSAENGKTLSDYPPANQPEEKENYTFAGWSSKPNQTKYADKDNKVYDYVVPETTVIEGHLSLYPIYVPDRLNVKLDFDGGSIPEAGNHEPQETDFFVDLNEKIAMKPLLNTEKDGYELAGWYTKDGLLWNGPDWKTLEYHDVDFVTVPHETVGWGVTPTYCDKDDKGEPIIQTNAERKFDYYTVTLTAKWDAVIKDITVKYQKADGTEASADAIVKTEESLTLPKAPAPAAGERFKGWKDSKGEFHSVGETLDYNTWKEFVNNDEVIFVATYEQIPTYSVSFDSDGGSYVETQEVTEGSTAKVPDEPKKPGYEFVKWVDADDTSADPEAFEFETKIYSAITLKAIWSVKQFTITYNTNGGETIPPITKDFGAEVTMPTNVNREHYEFQGWDKTYTTMPAENVTVNALWEPREYKLTLDPNGGKIGSATDPVEIVDIYGAEIKAETPEREGYDFTGWLVADKDVISLPKYMPDTNDTYVAQWKEKPVKVAPVLDGELTAEPITEGDELGKSTITGTMKYDGNVVDGTFWWVDPDTKPALTDSNTTDYDVLFIPTDYDKYENVPLKSKVEVKDPAKAVKDKIDNLPDLDKIDKDDKDAIDAARKAIEDARKAYDDLPDEQKKRIDDDTLKKLTDAEDAIKKFDPAPTPTPEPIPADKVTYDDLTSSEKPNANKIVKSFDVDKDTAAKMLRTGEELKVPLSTMLLSSKTLKALKNDNDPFGTSFAKLTARAVKRGKKTMRLQWKTLPEADGYLIYANKCGKKYKLKLVKTVKNRKTKKWDRKKLKKATYYKYLVVAYKNVAGQKLPIAGSVTVHCTTKAKKNTIAKTVKLNKKKLTVRVGKTVKLKGKEVRKEKKKVIKRHRVVCYESLNPKIAKVNKKTGKVTGVKRGKTKIYVYCQNGVYKKVPVTVK